MLKKSLLSIEKYFETKPYEVAVFRLWTALAGFFMPTFGYILIVVDPDAIDFISHRLIISIGWFTVLFASYRSEMVKRNLISISYIGNMISMLWIIWIVQVNDFSPNYCIGLFLCLCMGIIFRNHKEMIVFYLIILIVLMPTMNNSFDSSVNKYVFAIAVIIILTVYLVIMYQRNHINRNLTQLNKELLIKNQELEQFVYIASHDLKTPLRTIGSFASLLKRSIAVADKESIDEYTTYILSGAESMTTILDDLSRYTSLTNAELDFKSTNVKEMLEGIKKDILHGDAHPNVEILIPSDFPEKVFCNAYQIREVFQNLIDNGIKYNRSKQKKIIISFTETKEGWKFIVRDNGIGISSEFNEQVFKIFKRLHTNQEYAGTGIGLSICKRIAEIHKGFISIDSKLGQGTVIHFSISKKLLIST